MVLAFENAKFDPLIEVFARFFRDLSEAGFFAVFKNPRFCKSLF